MTQEEFLRRLREHEGLRGAVLNGITVDRASRSCTFCIVTDVPYTAEDESAAADLAREAAPASMRAAVRIVKLSADPQIVRKKILQYLEHSHRAAAACIAEEDIEVIPGDPVEFRFGVDAAERGFFEKNDALIPGIVKMLERNFCKKFRGSLADKEKPDRGGEEDEDEEEQPADYRPARTFPVTNFEKIDEADVPKTATYIEDCDFASESLTVCGEILYIQERVSKPKTDASGEVVREGKPYLRFTISDTTGKLTFSYYPRKATEEKIRELKEGDFIACTGRMEWYNEQLSFVARYINRGSVPENFVPEKRPSKALPVRYMRVAPEKLVDYDQLSLFGQSELPPDLVNNTFVVFDLETTGLVNNPAGRPGQQPRRRQDGRHHRDRRGEDRARRDPRKVRHARQSRAQTRRGDRAADGHHRRNGQRRAQDRRGDRRFLQVLRRLPARGAQRAVRLQVRALLCRARGVLVRT